MKFVEKKNIQFENGRFVIGDELIAFDVNVGDRINYLERWYQTAMYGLAVANSKLAANDSKPERFKFESAFADNKLEFTAETPTIDEQVERSKAIMQELDAKVIADHANEIANYQWLKELIEWVEADKVAITTACCCVKIDAKNIGNPLELTKEKLASIVFTIAEARAIGVDQLEDGDF